MAKDSHSSRAGRPVQLPGTIEALGALEPLRPHLGWLANAAPAAIPAGEDVEPPSPTRPA